MILFNQAKEKCEVLYCKLKVIVPDKFSIKEYKRKTDYILLSPRKHISREKDKSYSITDESGEKIPNIELVLVTRCNFKTEEVNVSADYFSLKGLPKNIAIKNIIYYKPSTKETLEKAILPNKN